MRNEMVIQPWVLLEQTDDCTHQAQQSPVASDVSQQLTVQVGQTIMPLPAGMPSRLLEARRVVPRPAERLRMRP
jgi:hypothetical protein